MVNKRENGIRNIVTFRMCNKKYSEYKEYGTRNILNIKNVEQEIK